MKIIHIIFGLQIGGAELMLSRLIRSNKDNSQEKHIIYSLTNIGEVGQELIEEGFKVKALHSSSVIDYIFNFFKLRKMLIQQNADIVHTWMYNANFFGGLAAYSVGIQNIVWCIRANQISKKRINPTAILRKICAWLSTIIPKKIVFVGNVSMKTHIKLGYSDERSVVIPNGYEVKKAVNDKQIKKNFRNNIRKKLKINSNDIVIISIARFHSIKDHSTFFKACKILLKDHGNIKFLLLGRETKKSSQLIKKCIGNDKHKDKFLLLGEQSNAMSYLFASDIFCLHSASEGFPNALGEAMLAGKPCVTTAVGEAPKMLNLKEYVVNIGSPSSLAASISLLINATSEQRVKIGCINQKRIVKMYDIDKIAKQYKKVYEQVNG